MIWATDHPVSWHVDNNESQYSHTEGLNSYRKSGWLWTCYIDYARLLVHFVKNILNVLLGQCMNIINDYEFLTYFATVHAFRAFIWRTQKTCYWNSGQTFSTQPGEKINQFRGWFSIYNKPMCILMISNGWLQFWCWRPVLVFPQHQHRPQHHNWNHAGVEVDLENYDAFPVVGVVAGVKYRLLIRSSRSVLAICM